MRVVSAILFVALVFVLADLAYWWHRFAPVMAEPGVALAPMPIELSRSGPVRHVDLGYAEFDLPQSYRGNLVRRGSSLFVELRDESGDRSLLTIGPPTSDREKPIEATLAEFAELIHEPVSSYWQLHRRVLTARPLAVWKVPFCRRQRIETAIMLLQLKSIQTASAEQLAIYENERIGVTVINRTDSILVQLADRKLQTNQRFILPPAKDTAVPFVSALVRSYRSKTTEFSAEAIAAKLDQTGMPRLTEVSAQTEPSQIALLEEQTRLRATLDELDQRLRRR